MFENRTFDNLLGRLYQPGEVLSFEGVIGKDLCRIWPGLVTHPS
jgi:phospholipase C